MSNELLREAWKELVFPLMDKYIQDLWTKRTNDNDWPARSVFSDLCKPFQVKDKKTKEMVIRLLCIVPPTPSFWSAILAMYFLFGRKTFKNHKRTCLIFLDEVNKAKFHVSNLTNLPHILKWLQECAGFEAKMDENWKMKVNIFTQDPVICAAMLQSDLMVVQGTKKVEECMEIDPKLIEHFQGRYDEISKRLDDKQPDDGQGKRDGEHGVEGERGLGSRDGDCVLGGAPDGDAQERPDELQLVALPDLRAGDPDPLHGQ